MHTTTSLCFCDLEHAVLRYAAGFSYLDEETPLDQGSTFFGMKLCFCQGAVLHFLVVSCFLLNFYGDVGSMAVTLAFC